jgi:hypothetical protein
MQLLHAFNDLINRVGEKKSETLVVNTPDKMRSRTAMSEEFKRAKARKARKKHNRQ